jgi:Fe-Mn family superoxide dismutase
MKLVVALALPAAALRPVKVTMSAAQNRRAFVIGGTAAAAAAATKANAYSLPDLPYAYDALEPSIDAATMKFHHDKHHATYIAGINGKLDEKDQPPIAELMKDAKAKGFNNAGGGVYNHDLFWKALAPAGKGGAPSKALAAAIDKKFGSLDKLKEEWAALGAPASTFGSGWVWLIVQGKDLAICNSPNQDNPLMKGAATEGIPILGLDVWEHAYYLKYQNRRPEYVAAFWDIVNWNQVNEWYDDALAGKAPQF